MWSLESYSPRLIQTARRENSGELEFARRLAFIETRSGETARSIQTDIRPRVWPLSTEVSFQPAGGIFGNFGKEASM